jgi:glutamyl-tRNA reductase
VGGYNPRLTSGSVSVRRPGGPRPLRGAERARSDEYEPCRDKATAPSPPRGTLGTRSPLLAVPRSAERPGAVPAARTPELLRLVAFERSLATGPLERLERATEEWSDERAHAALDLDPDLREIAALKTCHRLEVYAVVAASGAIARVEALLPRPRAGWRRWDGAEAVGHVFRVAGGLESLAVGEREVQTQVRRAAGRVVSRLPTGGLGPIFSSAADAAAAIGGRTESAGSIAKVGAARMLEEVGPPFPRVVVAGSGIVGRQVTEALAPSAHVTILHRSQPPEESFLLATGARAAPLSRLAEELALADGLMTALKSAGRLVGVPELVHRDPSRPLVIVDLGLPRNVDPEVAIGRPVRRIDLEHLRSSVRTPGPDPAGQDLLAAADRAYSAFRRAALEPFVAELWREAERLRLSEIARAERYLETLQPQERASVEKLTERLVRRILAGPTERLRELSVAEEESTVRELALRLFAPPAARP